jgi:hypothetical protein
MTLRAVVRYILHILRPVLRLLLRIFFDYRYIRGRHFDQGFDGYLWALRAIWCRNILRLATPRPWPVALGFTISNPANVLFHPDDLNNFQSSGVYMQNFNGRIVIGRGTYIAPNVGLITANHQLGNLDAHEQGRDIVLGEGCWIGMNSVVLPGVQLGPRTIVAAGAVVSKSYPEGRVVLAGVPARVVKTLA